MAPLLLATFATRLPQCGKNGDETVILGAYSDSWFCSSQEAFFDSYRAREEWDYYEVPATECPRISPAFLEEERKHMGDWWFTQEYMTRFADADTAAFRREDVEAAFAKEVEPWDL